MNSKSKQRGPVARGVLSGGGRKNSSYCSLWSRLSRFAFARRRLAERDDKRRARSVGIAGTKKVAVKEDCGCACRADQGDGHTSGLAFSHELDFCNLGGPGKWFGAGFGGRIG